MRPCRRPEAARPLGRARADTRAPRVHGRPRPAGGWIGHADGLRRDARRAGGPAHEAGNAAIESRALIVLAHLALYRDGDNDSARELAGRAHTVAEPDDDVARFDASEALQNVAWWEGDLEEVERRATEGLAVAERIERRDLRDSELLELNDLYNQRLEPERARPPLERAIELAAEGGLRRPAAGSCGRRGQSLVDGRLDDAQAALEQAQGLFVEAAPRLRSAAPSTTSRSCRGSG